MDIQAMVSEIIEKAKPAGGLTTVYFVACGGSLAAIYPGKYLLDAESETLSIKHYNSNEFVYKPPKKLDSQCLVICCSLKATPETVEAVKLANQHSAITLSMTGSYHTDMASAGQYVVTYSSGNKQIYSQSNQAQILRICFALLYQLENYPYYQEAMDAFAEIDGLVASAKSHFLADARLFGEKYKDDTIFYVLGSGALLGTAYTMVNCHLIEMQARHAVMLHSGEYFHGPFETTDQNLAIVLLMNTGKTRFLDERALSFLQKYAKRHFVIDANDYGITQKMGQNVSEYFNSVIMIPVERFYVSQMADIRGRSMDERNYMWKVDY